MEAEMSLFWGDIEKRLPNSEERHALGDEYLFHAVRNAYPQMREHIRKQTEKAFGGCTNCYGKGYSTNKEVWTGLNYREEKNPIHPCECDRGKQIAEIIRPLNDLE